MVGRMRAYAADLHVHTALSPCAEPEMTPLNIIGLCLEHGLDIIAVTDHNAAGNARAVFDFAKGTGLTVWPGMEVETREEVHLVVLADAPDEIEAWDGFIRRHLPDRPNRPEVLGEQVLFDSESRSRGVCPRLLLTAVDLGVDEIWREAVRRDLVCYPAHIDRPANSYISNLGLTPPEGQFGLVEISRRASVVEVKERHRLPETLTLVVSSDAHRLTDLGPARIRLHMAAPSLGEFRKAVAGRDGRKVELLHLRAEG